jgi:hypothetical protein
LGHRDFEKIGPTATLKESQRQLLTVADAPDLFCQSDFAAQTRNRSSMEDGGTSCRIENFYACSEYRRAEDLHRLALKNVLAAFINIQMQALQFSGSGRNLKAIFINIIRTTTLKFCKDNVM